MPIYQIVCRNLNPTQISTLQNFIYQDTQVQRILNSNLNGNGIIRKSPLEQIHNPSILLPETTTPLTEEEQSILTDQDSSIDRLFGTKHQIDWVKNKEDAQKLQDMLKQISIDKIGSQVVILASLLNSKLLKQDYGNVKSFIDSFERKVTSSTSAITED